MGKKKAETDSTTGNMARESMIAAGADIIFGVGGNTGNGGQVAAHEAGLWGIGVDVDEYYTFPDVAKSLLTSASKKLVVATNDAVVAYANGELAPGIRMGNAGNNGIVLAPYHDQEDNIPDTCKAAVLEAKDEFAGSSGIGGLPDLEGREITIAVENGFLPFNYIDPETGEPAGWDYEAWHEMCRLLNCTPLYVETSWEGMIQAVADGHYDVAADGIIITNERAEIVDFSDGYIRVDGRMLVRSDEGRFSSLAEVQNDASLVIGASIGRLPLRQPWLALVLIESRHSSGSRQQ